MNASKKHRVIPRASLGGFPELNFNRLYAEALNHSRWGKLEDWGHTYLALSHSDLKAEDGWIDALVDEMEKFDADVMTTVIPLKDETGATSTGVSILGNMDGMTRRITMTEAFGLPKTFCIDDIPVAKQLDCPYLAVNEGLCVQRWTEPWVAEFPGFDCQHSIVRGEDGIFKAHCWSEDWRWARWLATRKLRIYATRKVKVRHHGNTDFDNTEPWGTWETDLEGGLLGKKEE